MSIGSGSLSPPFALPPPAPAETRGPAWPLWAVYAASVVTGFLILVGSAGAAFAQAPAVAAVSVVLFGAFGAFWVWLLNKIPYSRPIDRDTKVLAALWGACAAIGFALLANIAIYEHLADREDAPAWSMFAPFTEEPIKNLGIVVVLLLAATRPRTALDGLVVGSFVGLGFEVVENVVQSVNNALAAAPPDRWPSLATDVIAEVLRRSWTGHIIITGIAGFGIAYAMTARHRSTLQRWAVGTALVLLALAGHLLWNSHRFGVFYVLGQFGTLAFYLWLIRRGRALESALYQPYLSYAAPSLLAAGADSVGKNARQRKRTLARLATAIANGDPGRAHEYAEKLGRPG